MILTFALGMSVLGQVVLTGSNIGLEEAQAKARVIAVARAQTGLVFGSGPFAFGNVDLRGLHILKGAVDGEVLKGAGVSASGPETFPKHGVEYIFFINDYANHPNVLKILPRTEENIAAVRKAIRARDIP